MFCGVRLHDFGSFAVRILAFVCAVGEFKEGATLAYHQLTVSKNHEFCIRNEDFCIQNDETFCIKSDEILQELYAEAGIAFKSLVFLNDGFCIKNDGSCI